MSDKSNFSRIKARFLSESRTETSTKIFDRNYEQFKQLMNILEKIENGLQEGLLKGSYQLTRHTETYHRTFFLGVDAVLTLDEKKNELKRLIEKEETDVSGDLPHIMLMRKCLRELETLIAIRRSMRHILKNCVPLQTVYDLLMKRFSADNFETRTFTKEDLQIDLRDFVSLYNSHNSAVNFIGKTINNMLNEIY